MSLAPGPRAVAVAVWLAALGCGGTKLNMIKVDRLVEGGDATVVGQPVDFLQERIAAQGYARVAGADPDVAATQTITRSDTGAVFTREGARVGVDADGRCRHVAQSETTSMGSYAVALRVLVVDLEASSLARTLTADATGLAVDPEQGCRQLAAKALAKIEGDVVRALEAHLRPAAPSDAAPAP